jgi:DNA-binding beta-propeller fold protein YncE
MGTTTTTTTLCTLVTSWGSGGSGPGQFDFPQGIDVSPAGTRVYVADLFNDRVQVFDPDGTFLFAFTGPPSSPEAAFVFPTDVAVDPLGNVFVLANDQVYKFDADGVFLTKWGDFGSAEGEFMGPSGIAVDVLGDVYVADSGNSRVQVFDGAGLFLRAWGSQGSGDGQFNVTVDVAVFDSDSVWVIELNDARRLQRFTTLGDFLSSRSLAPAFPYQLDTDASGNVYIVGGGNLSRLGPNGDGPLLTLWHSPGSAVSGVATAPGNLVYVTEESSNQVTKLQCPP